MKRVLLIGLVFALATTAYLLMNSKGGEAVQEVREEQFEELNWEHYEFPEVGLSFSAPFEMAVTGQMVDNETFTLLVERGAFPDEDYYQLYGLYNLTGTLGIDEEGLKRELVESSIKEAEISGYKAISGQYKGERNRLVTYIISEKGLFNLATSQPTESNGLLTDVILSTFVLE